MTNTSLYCKIFEYVSVNNNVCELLNHVWWRQVLKMLSGKIWNIRQIPAQIILEGVPKVVAIMSVMVTKQLLKYQC